MKLSGWQLYAIGGAIAALAVVAMLAAVLYAGPKAVHEARAPAAVNPLAPFVASAPRPVAAVAFDDPDGKRISLASFRGRTVLLNLWATWCAPCVKELPALAKLKAALPTDRFAVIAVNVGRGTAADARAFLDAHNAKALEAYTDSDLALLHTFSAYGLPLTVLIDGQGRETGRAVGPAPWDTPKAIAYFKALARLRS